LRNHSRCRAAYDDGLAILEQALGAILQHAEGAPGTRDLIDPALEARRNREIPDRSFDDEQIRRLELGDQLLGVVERARLFVGTLDGIGKARADPGEIGHGNALRHVTNDGRDVTVRSLGFRHQEVAELAAFGMFAAGTGLDSQNFHDALHANALLVG